MVTEWEWNYVHGKLAASERIAVKLTLSHNNHTAEIYVDCSIERPIENKEGLWLCDVIYAALFNCRVRDVNVKEVKMIFNPSITPQNRGNHISLKDDLIKNDMKSEGKRLSQIEHS